MSALLQIAEPGGDSRIKRFAGIDLGTTHSLVAVVDSDGEPGVLETDGSALLPSAVRYPLAGGPVLVGTPALAQDASGALFTSTKRAIGLTCGDLQGLRLPYGLAGQDQDPALLEVSCDGQSFSVTPEQVAADILRVLAERAKSELGGPLDGVVLTVPAYFSEGQRQACMRAAGLAGLNVLRLIAEPTAAALAYGLAESATGTVMVYDLGGGTFDCSVLVLREGVFEVRATAGDTRLGGDDLDSALAREVLRRCRLQWQSLAGEDRTALMREARACKERLSTEKSTDIRIGIGDSVHEVTVTEEELVELAEPLMQRTIRLCRRALRDAQMDVTEVDALVLAGGATRMPALVKRLADFFNREPRTGLDPDRIVALGAARHAKALGLGNSGDDMLLVDVTPLSLGIETLGGLTETILPRNSPLPASRAKDFTTARDGQTGLVLHVVQGERPLAEQCRSLARFRLSGIPPMVAGAARIGVEFHMDENGLLRVLAREKSTGIEAQVTTEGAGVFAEGEIRRILEEADASADEDDEKRRHRETLSAAESLLEGLRSGLRDHAQLLQEAELQRLKNLIDELEAQMAEGTTAGIGRAMDRLTAPADDFAHRRMDAAVRSAFRGKKLREL